MRSTVLYRRENQDRLSCTGWRDTPSCLRTKMRLNSKTYKFIDPPCTPCSHNIVKERPTTKKLNTYRPKSGRLQHSRLNQSDAMIPFSGIERSNPYRLNECEGQRSNKEKTRFGGGRLLYLFLYTWYSMEFYTGNFCLPSKRRTVGGLDTFKAKIK